MARYCKICGAKSGRCNHLVVDFGEREKKTDERKDEAKKPDEQS